MWTRVCSDFIRSTKFISFSFKHSEGSLLANKFYFGTVLFKLKPNFLEVTMLLQNHRAERHWVEVNSRINFPLKTALTNMQQQNVIDMDCPVTKFCVSMMTSILCQVGIQSLISSWNHHHVPGMVASAINFLDPSLTNRSWGS